MRKILFAFIFVLFTFSFISFQNVSSRTQKNDDQKKSVAETPTPKTNETEEREHSSQWLRNDMRVSDVVAYVDVKKVTYSGRSDDSTDCENNRGGGYCSYRLQAEVKEIFKGKIEEKPFEFYASADAAYPKKSFLGEQIVFLLNEEEDKNKKRRLGTQENSSREITPKLLGQMRNILNLDAVIDETDPEEPYSLSYIRENFEEADVIVYADVKSFKSTEKSSNKFLLTANVKEVFKGKLETERTIQYYDDLLYRPIREEDLGEQILYLERETENGKVFYTKKYSTEGWIRHNILEKLRRVAKEKSDKKD